MPASSGSAASRSCTASAAGGARCRDRHRLSGGQSAARTCRWRRTSISDGSRRVSVWCATPRCAVAPPRCSRSSICISTSRRPLGSYSVAVQHITAIARAVDLSARVLILDEPTASLDRHEVEILFAVMRKLAARGIGVLFVTHFLDQVYEICDRITVLRNGAPDRRARDRRAAAHRTDPDDARPRTRETTSDRAAAARTAGARGLRALRGLWQGRLCVAPFDLTLRHGEVVGLAGLLGSGRTETARLVFGVERADTGRAAGRRPTGPPAIAA